MPYKISSIENSLLCSLHKLGYIVSDSTITPSNRPELGDYQYNGVMSLAKQYHKTPQEIANSIIEEIKKYPEVKECNIAGPGFINIIFTDEFLLEFMNESLNDLTINYDYNTRRTIFLDYGGPNVAKTLHVGHLRSANIGEALKRLCQKIGCETICDVHLGDWGRPMGLIILEIKNRYPDLPYFKDDYAGEEVDFVITNDELLELYPIATTKAKEDENIMEEARKINMELQNKHLGYYNLWKKIVEASVNDVKGIFTDLNTHFDLWEGESDNFEYMSELFDYLNEKKLIVKSEGAGVIEVSEETDKLTIPPLILIKSNGAVSYEATDLAAIWERNKKFTIDEYWYLTDKRQELHFKQVFRAAYKSNIIDEKIKLSFIGFGTMNGPDGTPFKTREGNALPLKTLLSKVTEACEKRLLPSITKNRDQIAKTVAVAAIKYADLLPYRTTDYNFDIEKFIDLNGKTGPYLLYSTIRMKSLLKKAEENSLKFYKMHKINNESIRNIILAMLDLKRIIKRSFENRSLNEIAEYLYKITNLYNNFYSDNKVLTEQDKKTQETYLALTKTIYDNNVYLLDILGINIPEKM